MSRKASYLVLLGVVGIAAAAGYLSKSFRAPASAGYAAVSAPGAGPSGDIRGPYFSDRNRVATAIIAAIHHTHRSLDIAIYSFTDRQLEAAVVAAARRGVRVRVVADQHQADDPHSEIFYLRAAGVTVRLSGGYRGLRSIMHDKFAVFDDQWVETGSFNWTISAEDYNYENAIFLSDPLTVARYEREFERIWSRAQ
jgi:phosphatidylserine/phosphatidylglycerophosphate/cardiolipin synthase-like enzyme